VVPRVRGGLIVPTAYIEYRAGGRVHFVGGAPAHFLAPGRPLHAASPDGVLHLAASGRLHFSTAVRR